MGSWGASMLIMTEEELRGRARVLCVSSHRVSTYWVKRQSRTVFKSTKGFDI